MESVRSGSFRGAGSFRCTRCGYIVTLESSERLPECPSCGAQEFVRASMFSTERIAPASEPTSTGATSLAAPAPEHETRVAAAREKLDQPGDYVVYEDGGRMRVVPLTREWTRVGRSLAADVRFDDPTVSRRHALIVRQPDGLRVLDDRSLNGVFVNGERVEWSTLADGDVIMIGRHDLHFIDTTAVSGMRVHTSGQSTAI